MSGPKVGMSESITDSFNCSVCLDPFTDPRILPTCGHNFCLKCIKGVASHSLQGTVPCPNCRRTTDLGAVGGVNKLPKALIVQELQDKLLHEGALEERIVYCGPCGDRKNIPVRYCVTCITLLCQACYERHQLLPRYGRHQLKQLHEIVFCPKHESHEVSLYCHTCKKGICQTCLISGHAQNASGLQHRVSTVTDLLKQKHKELKDVIVGNSYNIITQEKMVMFDSVAEEMGVQYTSEISDIDALIKSFQEGLDIAVKMKTKLNLFRTKHELMLKKYKEECQEKKTLQENAKEMLKSFKDPAANLSTLNEDKLATAKLAFQSVPTPVSVPVLAGNNFVALSETLQGTINKELNQEVQLRELDVHHLSITKNSPVVRGPTYNCFRPHCQRVFYTEEDCLKHEIRELRNQKEPSGGCVLQ